MDNKFLGIKESDFITKCCNFIILSANISLFKLFFFKITIWYNLKETNSNHNSNLTTNENNLRFVGINHQIEELYRSINNPRLNNQIEELYRLINNQKINNQIEELYKQINETKTTVNNINYKIIELKNKKIMVDNFTHMDKYIFSSNSIINKKIDTLDIHPIDMYKPFFQYDSNTMLGIDHY